MPQAIRPFLGIRLHDFTLPELVDTLAASVPVAKTRPVVFGYINVYGLNLSYSDPEFRRIINAQDYVFCDGYGIKWGASLMGQRLRQRMTPPDWIDLLFRRALQDGSSFFLIGDSEKVIAKFRAQVEATFPGIRILGHQSGFFDHFGAEGQKLAETIHGLAPDYVLVGMGMPLQEKWVNHFLPILGRGVYLPVGALFRWYVNEEKRAPKWMTDNGLEWFARLLSNPKYVWRRYLIGNPLYVLRLLRARLFG
jgi:N-acetylglucosaminyldiphosphoundecaprenol N-acetyl-beta-D-mannosaminyltransferase